MAELQAKLEELERERDAIDSECNELHSKHGDALNQIELLKEQIANQQQSEPAAAIELPDLEKIRDQVAENWRVKKGAENKDRIKLALDKFIEAIRKQEDGL